MGFPYGAHEMKGSGQPVDNYYTLIGITNQKSTSLCLVTYQINYGRIKCPFRQRF